MTLYARPRRRPTTVASDDRRTGGLSAPVANAIGTQPRRPIRIAMTAATGPALGTVTTRVPARLDRLPWSRWHWLVVIGLGTVWILDGLEVTIVGSIAARLTEPGSGLALTAARSDRGGALRRRRVRRRAVLRPAHRPLRAQEALHDHARRCTSSPRSPPRSRSPAGTSSSSASSPATGIGGEYAAINSAIDELIPARIRGSIDLAINGTYWLGAAGRRARRARAARHAPLRRRRRLAPGVRHRRRARPRHPARAPARAREPALAVHPRPRGGGRARSSSEIEARGRARRPARSSRSPSETITVRQRDSIAFREIARTAIQATTRAARVLGLALFVGQAFLYNAVTFDLGTSAHDVLQRRLRARSRCTSPRSRSATSSARCCSAGCSTPSGAADDRRHLPRLGGCRWRCSASCSSAASLERLGSS